MGESGEEFPGRAAELPGADAHRGAEVVLCGRFASMGRAEARERLLALGARPARSPGPRTALVIVGEHGLPIARDGRPRRLLERARELQRRGAPLRILGEEEWLAEIGLVDIGRVGGPRSVRRECTAAELSRLLGVPAAAIRAWSRAGLVRASRTLHRLELFEFREVAAAKALSDLVARGISPARVRRSLERVRAWLPAAAGSLVARALLGERGELLLRLDGGGIADASGQLRLDFAGGPAAGARILRTPRQWHAEGQRREDAGELAAAANAYREALHGDPHLVEARFGLANVLYLLEDAAEAAAEYLRAVEIDPEYVEAWNNLGNAFAELGEVDAALRAYQRAVAIAPEYGDAHFNLAEALWGEGDAASARPHYAAFLEREPASPWARHARERLGS